MAYAFHTHGEIHTYLLLRFINFFQGELDKPFLNTYRGQISEYKKRYAEEGPD